MQLQHLFGITEIISIVDRIAKTLSLKFKRRFVLSIINIARMFPNDPRLYRFLVLNLGLKRLRKHGVIAQVLTQLLTLCTRYASELCDVGNPVEPTIPLPFESSILSIDIPQIPIPVDGPVDVPASAASDLPSSVQLFALSFAPLVAIFACAPSMSTFAHQQLL